MHEQLLHPLGNFHHFWLGILRTVLGFQLPGGQLQSQSFSCSVLPFEIETCEYPLDCLHLEAWKVMTRLNMTCRPRSTVYTPFHSFSKEFSPCRVRQLDIFWSGIQILIQKLTQCDMYRHHYVHAEWDCIYNLITWAGHILNSRYRTKNCSTENFSSLFLVLFTTCNHNSLLIKKEAYTCLKGMYKGTIIS